MTDLAAATEAAKQVIDQVIPDDVAKIDGRFVKVERMRWYDSDGEGYESLYRTIPEDQP